MKDLRVATLAAGAALLLSGTALAADPIKIGVVLPFSGVYASIGNDVTDAMQMAIDELGGKAGGRDIVLVREDSEVKPPVGLAKMKKLVHQKKVNLVVGPVASHVAAPMAQFAAQAKVPLLIPNAGNNILTGAKCSRWVIRTSFSNDQFVRIMGPWLKKKGYNTAFLMAPDYTAGHDMMDGFRKVFEAAGGKIVGEAFPPFRKTKDYAPFLAKVKAAKPDVIFVFFAGGEAIQFVKQFDAFGLKSSTKMTGPGWTVSPLFLPAQGMAAEGYIGSQNYVPSIDSAINKAFVKNFTAKTGHGTNEFAAQGYDTGRMIHAALEKIGGKVEDKEAFLKAMHDVKVQGSRGPLRIDPKTNNVIQDMYVFETRKAGDKVGYAVLDTIKDVQDEPNGCKM
jgi:branched-chain amino acid transport system substrate-binding protein